MNVALDESVVILGRNISLKDARPQKETDLEPFIVCDCVMLEVKHLLFVLIRKEKISRFFACGSE
jgi:hypothetical protein